MNIQQKTFSELQPAGMNRAVIALDRYGEDDQDPFC